MDFDYIYTYHSLPNNFKDYYLDYINNPLTWLIPFDNNKSLLNLSNEEINLFIDNIININIVNDYLLYNKNNINKVLSNNNIYYYYMSLLMSYNKDNNLILEDLFDIYFIYYNINNKKCHNLQINKLNKLGQFINIIMDYILYNDNTIEIINNSSIEHYYNHIYDKSIKMFKELNNITTNNIYELFDVELKYNVLIYPPTQITDKLYCNNIKKYFNYNYEIFLPIYYKKLFDKSFDIYNYYNKQDITNNINKVNNYMKLSKFKNIKFNKINNINIEDLVIINNYINEYNEKKNTENNYELITLIGNIDCLINHKNFVY